MSPGAKLLAGQKKEKKIRSFEGEATAAFSEGEEQKFGFLFFCVFYSLLKLQNDPPLEFVEKTTIYRKNIARFFNLVPQLLFVCKFDFLKFFCIFENE